MGRGAERWRRTARNQSFCGCQRGRLCVPRSAPLPPLRRLAPPPACLHALPPSRMALLRCAGVLLLLLVLSPLYSDGEVAEVCSEQELTISCANEAHNGGSGVGSTASTTTTTSSSRGDQIVLGEAWLYGSTSIIRDIDPYLGNKTLPECHVPEFNLQYKAGSILQYINKECGGQVSCKFSLQTHVPLDHQFSQVWRGGALWVRYNCVSQSSFHRVCGTEVKGQEGWLKSVGYPQYYLGNPSVCTLTVTADQGQRLQLTISDLSIREIMQPTETRCKDSVEVSEGSKVMLERCGDTNRPLTITSVGPSLNVTLSASSHVFPKRGYVAYYKALGCPTPDIPQDGYLAFRNGTHAEFWCCVRHAFPDTLTRKRVLECGRLNTWNEELPDCVDLDELLNAGNITMEKYLGLINGTSGVAMAEKLRQAHIVYDLVVPTIIMSVLVLGNVAVVFLIIYCRRGVIEEGVRCEELESIKANPEPTDTIDNEPCNV
ncbi:uncharacterized protein LOC135113074 [Scylla paramamosain]|uniref:uncharacterized protein LOC135113074 n=1 Tax=Scylla paramamosain TaxID=85552 RepID=UPI003083453C